MSKKHLLTMLSTAAISAVAALSVPTSALVAAPSAEKKAEAKKLTNKLYIVRMAELPVAAYDGSIKGYQATKPKNGQKLDPNNSAVVNYKAYLDARHDAMLNAVGGAKKVYSYGYVYNGFAAELTEEQAARLERMPGVLGVMKDELLHLDTASTPSFLGLTGTGGAWQTAGVKGEDVIIGIIDGGVWPEHPSLSDRTDFNGNGTKDGKLGYQQIPGWNGRCVPGEAFAASNCNQKLIGARYFNAGWGGNDGIDAQLPWEFNSPRDFGGHGTHVATTSGGNENVAVTGQAAVLGKMSGIAPRARISSYKVCWETGSGGSCFSTDSIAAIDQAVIDGVDVINFSVSGSRTNFRDGVEIAFLFAADAGVFVATSAGNSGPTTSTVAHPGPWLTTVAAGTHNRDGAGSVTLGNGTMINGASLAGSAVTAPLIAAEDAGKAGADATALRLCYAAADGGNQLDPAKVAGKIVVCDRGVTARTNKSLAVKEAGGVGMVLANTSPNSLNADFHAVPSVHVADTNRATIVAYSKTAGATATIAKGVVVATAPAPFTASFSSRGPLLAGGGDILKPDIIAPGQDVLAGVAPPGNGGELFALYSGTSMSSPHVAGLAALMKQKYPRWSPAMIKSAMMTTAGDVLDGPNTSSTVIFRQGAGHVRPPRMFDPGLVYDHGYVDWLNFICGTQPGSFCSAFTPIDPSNLNLPSIAIGDMAGTQKVKRTVTNVSGKQIKVDASLTGMSGFNVTVSPASLTIPAGGKASYEVTFTRTTATLNNYTGGQLTWANAEYSVRSPIVVRPVAIAVPASVSASATGASYNVTFGYDGPFSAVARGLVAPKKTASSVAQDPDQEFVVTDPTGTTALQVTIPAGSTYARFGIFDADVNPGADIDMFVYQGSTLVGSSTTGTSTEEVNFSFSTPTAAPLVLTVYVHGWGTVTGSTPFVLHEWYVGTASAGNMAVTAPATATLGGSGTISLGFTGLVPGTKYLGSVAYGGTASATAPTIVSVNP